MFAFFSCMFYHFQSLTTPCNPATPILVTAVRTYYHVELSLKGQSLHKQSKGSLVMTSGPVDPCFDKWIWMLNAWKRKPVWNTSLAEPIAVAKSHYLTGVLFHRQIEKWVVTQLKWLVVLLFIYGQVFFFFWGFSPPALYFCRHSLDSFGSAAATFTVTHNHTG